MPEAITKYAVNSTLGTADFEPLDKIIKSQRTYAASDSVLAVLGSNLGIHLGTIESDLDGISFTSKVNGSIRAKLALKNATNNTNLCYVFVNLEGSVVASGDISVGAQKTEELFVDFPIIEGATYTFSGYSPSLGGVGVDSISLCGQVVDLSMLEIGGGE